jgi:hypothetical protein
MISQPDPCRKIPFRPPVFDEINPILNVEYKPVNICMFVCVPLHVCIMGIRVHLETESVIFIQFS